MRCYNPDKADRSAECCHCSGHDTASGQRYPSDFFRHCSGKRGVFIPEQQNVQSFGPVEGQTGADNPCSSDDGNSGVIAVGKAACGPTVEYPEAFGIGSGLQNGYYGVDGKTRHDTEYQQGVGAFDFP